MQIIYITQTKEHSQQGNTNKQTVFVQAFKIVVDSWKFTMLLLYILWDDWPIFMIYNWRRLLKIHYVIAIHLMRWLTKFYDFRFKWTATAAIGIHPTKAWLSQLGNFKNAIWKWGHFRRTICNKILFKTWIKLSQKRMECFKLLLEHLAWIEHQFLSGIRVSRKAGSLWGNMRGVGGVSKSIDQSWLAKGLELGLGSPCWGFKGVQEEIPREDASTLQIGSVAFPPGQCTSRQVHPCHRLFDQDGHQDSSSASL